MRLSVASLRRMIKGKLHVEFVRQELTSYSGLEVLRRYLRQLELPRRLRAACAATGGDYGGRPQPLHPLLLLQRVRPPPDRYPVATRRTVSPALAAVGPGPSAP